MPTNFQAVLFDLDGTLVDTAPDMGHALNQLLMNHQRPQINYESFRPQVSHGAAALLKLGFDIDDHDPGFNRLRKEFLDLYQQNIAVHSSLFEGMDRILSCLENIDVPWGIVTNKPGYLTDQLLQKLDIMHRTSCVISGDTLPQRKPHPAPMLAACSIVSAKPCRCIYVGDAQRDIEAAHAAGMKSCAALYGYYPATEDPCEWKADFYINHPDELMEYINLSHIEPVEQ